MPNSRRECWWWFVAVTVMMVVAWVTTASWRRRSSFSEDDTSYTLWSVFGLWDRHMPAHVSTLRDRNRRMCPGFRFTVYDRAHVRRAIGPHVWERLERTIPRKVVLADIARYYLMWTHGGFYIDMDVRVRRNLESVVRDGRARGARMILFSEHDRLSPKRLGPRETHTHRIYNCMFWSAEAGDPFWKECYDLALERVRAITDGGSPVWTDRDILWASGPDVVTTVYHRYRNDPRIHVWNHARSQRLLTHLAEGTWRAERDVTAV